MSAPPMPTDLHPRDGSIVLRNNPQVSVNLARGAGNTLRVRAHFTLATDSIFTTDVIDWTQPPSQNNNGGVHHPNIPASLPLHQATWYIKATAVQETSGLESAETPIQLFTVSHPLDALPTAPNNVVVDYAAGSIPLSWTFHSTEPTARQTAYQVVIQTSGGGAIADTGKVTSTDKFYVSADLAGDLDTDLRWNVTLWDEDDIAGDASTWTYFVASAGPGITADAPSGTLSDPGPTVSWSFSAVGGRAQGGFYVAITEADTGLTAYASGLVLGSASSFTIPGDVLRNNTDYVVTVAVTDTGGITRSATNSFSTSWTPPATPSTTLDNSNYITAGNVSVSWSSSVDGAFFAWRVYRRYSGEDDAHWKQVSTNITDSGETNYLDFSAPNEASLEYAVVQVKNEVGEFVESTYAAASTDTAGAPDYWLVDPAPGGVSLLLISVTDDTFADEFESEEQTIIGRGRRVEFGDEWGYRGSLTASLRNTDAQSARDQRLALEFIKRTADFCWLRNPFGDSWKVLVDEISIQRVAGVGLHEYAIATIPYVEVY